MITLANAAAIAPAFAHGFAPWPFFIIFPLFWLAIIVVVIVLIATRRRRGWGPYGWRQQAWQAAESSRGAEATLAERFAQGDIEEVEYRARLEVLRANRPTPGPAR